MQKSYICKTKKDIEYLVNKYNLDTYLNYRERELPIIVSVKLKIYPDRPYNWCHFFNYHCERCKDCAIGCKDLIDLSKLRQNKLERILNE